jgi:hypothetical protein
MLDKRLKVDPLDRLSIGFLGHKVKGLTPVQIFEERATLRKKPPQPLRRLNRFNLAVGWTCLFIFFLTKSVLIN